MNRVEKRKLILGFLDIMRKEAGGFFELEAAGNTEVQEWLDYRLDEYLGMEDDVLVGAQKEMAEYVKKMDCQNETPVPGSRISKPEDALDLGTTPEPPVPSYRMDTPPPSYQEDTIVGVAPPVNPPPGSQDTLIFRREPKKEE